MKKLFLLLLLSSFISLTFCTVTDWVKCFFLGYGCPKITSFKYAGIFYSQQVPKGAKRYLCINGDLTKQGFKKSGTMTYVQVKNFSKEAIYVVQSDAIKHGRDAAWICNHVKNPEHAQVVSIIRAEKKGKADNKLSYVGIGEKPSKKILDQYTANTAQ